MLESQRQRERDCERGRQSERERCTTSPVTNHSTSNNNDDNNDSAIRDERAAPPLPNKLFFVDTGCATSTSSTKEEETRGTEANDNANKDDHNHQDRLRICTATTAGCRIRLSIRRRPRDKLCQEGGKDKREVRCLAILTWGKRCCYAAVATNRNRYYYCHSSFSKKEQQQQEEPQQHNPETTTGVGNGVCAGGRGTIVGTAVETNKGEKTHESSALLLPRRQRPRARHALVAEGPASSLLETRGGTTTSARSARPRVNTQ
mmetsp:Transcript_6110/g.12418  ORF Transcript_6110/g.12418 Transcript_6110/m.12418 type:complete len:261 (+) Transcript_6110:614-1396(+)